MSDNTRQAQDTMESSPAHRQQYAAPSLKVFGPVGALTQAGTGIDNEQMSGQGPTTRMA